MLLGVDLRFFFCRAAARFEFSIFTLQTALLTLRARDDIDDDLAVVFAALGACMMRAAHRAALTTHGARRHERVVGAPLGGFRSVATHSYYHIGATIQVL